MGRLGPAAPAEGGFPDGLTRREGSGDVENPLVFGASEGQGQISPFPQKGAVYHHVQQSQERQAVGIPFFQKLIQDIACIVGKLIALFPESPA